MRYRFTDWNPDTTQAKTDAGNALTQTRALQEHLDQLALATAAMWSFVREKLEVTEDEFAARMVEIDMLDGRRDGKMSRAAAPCAKCGKALSGRRMRCMFCGELRKDVFPK